MKAFHNLRNRTKLFITIITVTTIVFGLLSSNVSAAGEKAKDDPKWTIYFHPGVRFGTDDRTLYIMDYLVPLYQGDKNILFANPKYTPNDKDGWEVNLGLGYRHLLFNDSVILGVNGFYDRRKTPWGSIHEQWGIGAEVMAEVPVGEIDLGLTGRVNYYRPITPAKIDITMGDPDGYILMGNGIYSSYGVLDATIEEPLSGFDAEIGMRTEERIKESLRQDRDKWSRQQRE
jgi:hypothetical protein